MCRRKPKKIEEAGINTITQSRLEATLEYRSVDERLTGSSSVLEDIRAYYNPPVIFKVRNGYHIKVA